MLNVNFSTLVLHISFLLQVKFSITISFRLCITLSIKISFFDTNQFSGTNRHAYLYIKSCVSQMGEPIDDSGLTQHKQRIEDIIFNIKLDIKIQIYSHR